MKEVLDINFSALFRVSFDAISPGARLSGFLVKAKVEQKDFSSFETETLVTKEMTLEEIINPMLEEAHERQIVPSHITFLFAREKRYEHGK